MKQEEDEGILLSCLSLTVSAILHLTTYGCILTSLLYLQGPNGRARFLDNVHMDVCALGASFDEEVRDHYLDCLLILKGEGSAPFPPF